MLVFNLLILGVGVSTVSSRSIGQYMPHINIPSPFAPYTNTHSHSHAPIVSDTTETTQQCLFTPHQPLQKTQTPDSIPSHAWPHIRSLLSSHSNLLHPPAKSSVQTLRLAELTSDSSLEGVVLGLVYTVPESRAGQKELRGLVGGERSGLGEGDKQRQEQMCLDSAMREVEMRRQMEGVLEMDGKGKVGFLVYRVD